MVVVLDIIVIMTPIAIVLFSLAADFLGLLGK